ncbi:uncharacterized protein N7500_006382 [Penicillium coprophilum]|uniref:uncharacterized protein n=1 Tax=Penicillium coprophilum TaxID=36646 RepID=UPI002395FAA2|nr:uncharacterized protein N7500_006382 [Penicillium coprophilum]KAJ5164552.1 hypothetical protein N7500_006382 [Penicillium coprophilum]
MQQILLILNSLASFSSAAAALISTAKPALLSNSPHVTNGERFYQRMYAVRAVPLEVLTAILPFYLGGPAVASIIGAAAFVQAADVVIGIGRKDAGMIFGASFATAVHVLCFFSIS